MTQDKRRSRRRGGRPRKSDLERRGEQLHFRVRPDELAAIEQRAAACRRPLSDFIREQAMSGSIRIRHFQTLSPVDRHDLARIGSNLNQIARICNASGDSAPARAIGQLLDELRQLLGRIDGAGASPDELGQG